MTQDHKTYRIGVDVGGTNTDAVILDLAHGAARPVLASHKSHTTPDVTEGIQNAVEAALAKADIDRTRIQAVAIGTTSFVNSLIERDARVLERVAVIRLCGPHSRLAPPFVSFPYELRAILEGPVFFADGGLQVDGRELDPVNVEEIRGICAEIKRQGIKTVAISSIYSPIDREFRQEELARSIVNLELPGVRVTISKEVANIGILQRENATILNAALIYFAEKTVAGFQASTRALNLDCPLFLTSNDGTLMSVDQAEKFPIKTFSSGPTNSMRGANFLAGLASGGKPRRETALVVDVGGTTTEIGVLLPTGFPRQAGATHELCGVSLNFSMPHVQSIGLGGGSRVRKDEATGKISVGPDSVGYRIDKALSFGGDTLVTTDIMVAAGRAKGVGSVDKVAHLEEDLIAGTQARIKTMLEAAIDSMKTSTQDVPVYLVGGGAILAPDSLRGVSQVHRFPFYDAANAVGAACAQISGVVDTFEDTSGGSIQAVQKEVEKRAIAKAVAAGANPANCVVVESEAIPIAYSQGRCRFYVKAAGEWSGAPVVAVNAPELHEAATNVATSSSTVPPVSADNQKEKLPTTDRVWTVADLEAYKPEIVKREWFLSEIDLEWIATGCYILGCGGGGSPSAVFLGLRQMLRAGGKVRVIDLEDMDDTGVLGWGGGIGSPEVGAERLMNAIYTEAVQEICEFLRIDNLAALAAIEIGGGNGMINMVAGATLNLPVVDGDFMGRAYPTGWQVTPNVYATTDRGEPMLPAAMASGDGNVVFMTKAKHYKEVDSVLRGACIEMGTAAGAASKPLTKPECQQSMIRNTVSLSWRIGRAVALARNKANLGNLGPVVIDAVGGDKTARVLFSGKITGVNRKLYKGHSVGEVVIQALRAEEEEEESDNPSTVFKGTMTIPFKNENLLAEHTFEGKTDVVAGVPDLIAVLDTGSGEALGTPDYKYGLRVLVVAITAAPQWTDTARGLELGALPAFGYDLPYNPVGKYVKPRSVIEEYSG